MMSTTENRRAYLIHEEIYIALSNCPHDISARTYNAIGKYALTGLVDTTPDIEPFFALFRAQFDRDNEAYQHKCEVKRAAGQRGGLAKAANRRRLIDVTHLANVADATLANQTLPNRSKTYIENDSDSDNDNDSDSIIATPSRKISQSAIDPTGVPFPKWTLEQFKRSVDEAIAEHPEYGYLRERFVAWYTEKDPKGKFLFQTQKTWSTPGRLATWHKNEFRKSTAQSSTPATAQVMEDEQKRLADQRAKELERANRL